MRRGCRKRRHGGEPNQPETPSWMWTRRGAIQLICMDFDGKPKLGLPVFMTYEDAKAFIGADEWGRGTRPAEIGTVVADGHVETLEGILLGHAHLSGVEYMAVGRRINGERAWQIWSRR